MSLSQAERRNALAARVLHDLAVHRRELPVVSTDGTRPIVVALDGELLSAVVRRVKECGGSANLFVELAHDDVALLSVSDRAGESHRAEVFSKEPMPGSVTIGMLATYVATAPDGVQVTVNLPKLDADLQYVERRELVDA